MCDVEIPVGETNLTLPNFPVPADSGCGSAEEYFDKVLADGFETRRRTVWAVQKEKGVLRYDLDAYQQRLREESEIIKRMGFPGYFLIVWEFIRYAKQKGIPVGPGRGSAAGSLAAYCMEISTICFSNAF
jgi:DNA polymerase-3 subunit alpha